MPDRDRLDYIWCEGATEALVSLGWTVREHPDACPFSKRFGKVTEFLSFRKSKVVTEFEVVEQIGSSRGAIKYRDFLEIYLKFYDGKPPVLPM